MFRKIVSFFKSLEADNVEIKSPSAGSAYFHEDLFRQVEFVPRENIDFLKSENDKVNEFAQNHSDGSGFTDLYIRGDENQMLLLEKEIEVKMIDSLLTKLGMRKIENVYYFYGSTTVKSENTIVYDFKEAQIFIVQKDNFIKDFFINGFRFHQLEEDKLKLQEILFKVGTEFSLVLNDWDLTISIDLEDKNEIKKYLNEEF
ncbi:hypothetical protein [Flavobacterium sp. LC2016-01]|uniref:hypothetical protein n=1 Tax=Flavobacterium sp. LC2016-01 TaxID=2675876 RepID=UPI0012BAAF17|nr:hypothetical protein [Flavobacterium sp. LC2016-01]MTH17329.1 hypothetical protein [Flavobacterium sp. LC2016-01]